MTNSDSELCRHSLDRRMLPLLRQAPEDAREAALQEAIGWPVAVLRCLLYSVEVAALAWPLMCQVQHERTAAGGVVKPHPHADLRKYTG